MIDLDLRSIAPGSTTLVHSSIARLLRMHKCMPADILEAILRRLGPDGTLVLPLFNFDFTKGVPFDIRNSPSHMGALTEIGRLQPGAVRTGHPIYSFAVIGAKAEAFRGVDNISGYAEDSPFGILRRLNGDIAVIDLPDQNSMTFYHHVEELHQVPYRFHKSFSGTYIDQNGEKSVRTYLLFVRDLEKGVRTSVDRMGERLWEKGLYRGDRPKTGSGIRVIQANAMFDEVSAVIKSGQARDFLYDVE